MSDLILELKDISFGYNNDLILENVNLSISKGQYIGIVGVNGSGKSTLLKLILGILKPSKGCINKDKETRIGYVNQTTMTEEGAFPATVYEIVSLGLRKRPFSLITKEEKKAVDKILELFSLKALANSSIQSLSGGQAQKVKIAKVLISNPDIIVLDEPTTGIDEASAAMLQEIIAHLHAMKKTIILVSHNKNDFSMCDVIYQVYNRTIVNIKEVPEDV